MKKANFPKLTFLKKSKKSKSSGSASLLLTSSAAFLGVVIGVMGSLGFVGNYLHTQFANENAALSHQISSLKTNLSAYKTAAFTSSGTSSGQCTIPSASTANNVVTPSVSQQPSLITASSLKQIPTTTSLPSSTVTKVPPISVYPFVQELSNGHFTTTGTVSDTGYASNNNVTTNNAATQKVTNDNNLSINLSNPQTSTSGSSTVKNNTSSGSTTSGNTSNTSTTSLDVKVQN